MTCRVVMCHSQRINLCVGVFYSICLLTTFEWSVSGSMHRLYWVDSQLDHVGHVDFQGNDRQTFTNIGEITQPFSLTVYKGEFLSLVMITYILLMSTFLIILN